ncbi:hypothetical protein JCM10212_006361 [Sporobolomyces blumeae]
MACVRRATATITALPRRHARSLFNLPSFPSPFASTSSSTSSTNPVKKGALVKQGSHWVYREGKVMPYTPDELYTVIADVDSYHEFLPFTSSSRVLSATRLDPSSSTSPAPSGSSSPASTIRLADKPWLVRTANRPGSGRGDERWVMDAELRIGAMGFDEGYVSRVELDKGKSVKATAKDASMFRHLVNVWSFTPLSTSSSSSSSSTPDQRPKTQVDLSLEYAFTSPLHAAAISAVWDKVSALMVDKFEQRVRDVYGSR